MRIGVWRGGFATTIVACVALAVTVGFAARASAAQYSSIVIDAQSGQIVSEYDADSPNYPASLTKMMTLYLTFEALEHHEISLDTGAQCGGRADGRADRVAREIDQIDVSRRRRQRTAHGSRKRRSSRHGEEYVSGFRCNAI